MRKYIDYSVCITLLICILILVGVACVGAVFNQAAYESGAEAYKMGINAEANPYLGRWVQTNIESQQAYFWLKGWQDEKEKSGAQGFRKE